MTAVFGSLGIALLVPVLFLGVAVLAVMGVGGSREPDPTGRRQRAVYYGAVAFVALFIMLFAFVAGVTALTSRVGNHEVSTPSDSITGTTTTSTTSDNGSVITTARPQVGIGPEGSLATKRAESQALASGIVFLVAGAVFLFHRRRMQGLVAEPDFPIGPSRRPVQGYIYAVCFVAALLVIAGTSTALFGFVRILVPSVTGPLQTGERTAGVRELVSTGSLTLGAALLFLWHFRQPDEFDLRAATLGMGPGPAGPGGPGGPDGGFTPPPPPPPPPPWAPAAPRPDAAQPLDPSPFAPPEPPPLPLEPAEPARKATKATKAVKTAKAAKAVKAVKKAAPAPAPPEPADSEPEGGPLS